MKDTETGSEEGVKYRNIDAEDSGSRNMPVPQPLIARLLLLQLYLDGGGFTAIKQRITSLYD